MKVRDLVPEQNYCFSGDGDWDIQGITFADCAAVDDIAIAFTEKEIERTEAQVVLTHLLVQRHDKMVVYTVHGLYEAAVELAERLVAAGYYRDYGLPVAYTLTPDMVRLGKDCHIGHNVRIEGFTTIGDNVTIGDNTYIGENVSIGSDVMIGKNCILKPGARIGTAPFFPYKDNVPCSFAGIGTVILDDNVSVGVNTVIQRGTFSNTVVEQGTAIGDLVVIGHDVSLGEHCLIVSEAGISSRVTVEKYAKVLGSSCVAEGVHVGPHAVIMGNSGVSHDVKAGETVSGRYGRNHQEEIKLAARLRRLAKRRK